MAIVVQKTFQRESLTSVPEQKILREGPYLKNVKRQAGSRRDGQNMIYVLPNANFTFS